MNNYFWNILGYNINHAIKELNDLKLLSKDIFWEKQRKKRDAILQHHYLHTPWYKNFLGDKNNLDWCDIPIITKRDLQNFTSNQVKYRCNKFYNANTSGSSGHPFSFWKDKWCHSLAWANIQISYSDLGILSNDKEARFVGHVKGSIKTKLLESIKDIFFNRIRLDIFDCSDAHMMNYLDIIKEKKIGYIYGYANTILFFSKFIIKNKLLSINNNCPSLKLCIVTAEMCHDDDRKIIEKALGVPTFIEYGASEVSIIAIEDKLLNWRVSTDRLWIEILDQDDKPVKNDKVGKIIITDLYNKAFPFIRYNIGDIGALQEYDFYPFLLLKDLWGRQSDLIILPSGRKAPGLTFYYISRSILEKSHKIEQFVIIQKTVNTFIYQIVAKVDLADSVKQDIRDATTEYLEPGLIIKFEIVQNIQKKYSEKIQHFFSEII